MKTQEIRTYLETVNPEALFIGREEEHDGALIGTCRIKREEQWVEVAMYSYDELIATFSKQFEDSEDPQQDALEWVDYNVMGAYMGINTPYIVYN